LQLIDVALKVFSKVAVVLREADFQTLSEGGIAATIKRFASDTADGDVRRLIRRSNALRESIDL